MSDVTLHQAFKFSPQGEQLLALGTPMQSGSGRSKFCKPTQVAVSRDGSIFVAGGPGSQALVAARALQVGMLRQLLP